MSEIKIETGIPVSTKSSRHGPARYPIQALAEAGPGASFMVSCPQDQVRSVMCHLAGLASGYKRRHPGTDFTTRTVEGGVRIWRTK